MAACVAEGFPVAVIKILPTSNIRLIRAFCENIQKKLKWIFSPKKTESTLISNLNTLSFLIWFLEHFSKRI